MRILLALLLLAVIAFAKRLPRQILLGECYDFQTPSDLDLTKFTSEKWYEIQRYDNFFQNDAKCASQVFFLDATNSKIDISFSFQQQNGSLGLAVGKLNFTKTESGFAMDVIFPLDSKKSSFAVLTTDNNSYAVTYSCQQTSTLPPPEKQERFWILSRTPTMSNDTLKVIRDAVLVNGTDLTRYCDLVTQENCS